MGKPRDGFRLALLGGSSASATVHVVNQTGLTFVLQDITIQVGDTVQWVRSGGSHTVTEGLAGGPCSGCAFDSPLNAGTPTFSLVFDSVFLAANPRVGDRYDYYCQPHFGSGMIGSVTVSPQVPALPSWGLIVTAGLLVGAAVLVLRRRPALG